MPIARDYNTGSGMLRAARIGRGSPDTGKRYYEDYGFDMTSEQYKAAEEQKEAFETSRVDMASKYSELADPYKQGLEDFIVPDSGGSVEQKEAFTKLWGEEDTISIHVPYKDREQSLGEIPASMWKDLSNAISSSEDFRNRTYINAPLASDVPDYYAKLQEIKDVYAEQGDAYSEYIEGDDESGYGEPGYSVYHDPAEELWADLHQTTQDAGYTSRFSLGLGKPSAGLADRMMESYDDLNTEGEGTFNIIGSDYSRALFYGMSDITAGIKDQWSTAVRTQYEETRQSYEQDLALLDNELAGAEVELQGYLDEFNTGIDQYAEQYQSALAAKDATFKSFR